MIYDWFFVFNYDEFSNLRLASKTYTVILNGIGQKDILVTKGENFGMTYEGVFLALGLNEKNPFEFDGHAIYLDANSNVWLGLNGREPDEN